MEETESEGRPAASGEMGSDAALLEVYWRPGCGFCAQLFRALEHAGVAVAQHNIWEDDLARAFVREHNHGNETVPTVALGQVVLTNPNPAVLLEILRTRYPHLIGDPS